MAFAFVYMPCPSQEAAEALGRQLVEERLAACSNVFPITSIYWWQEQLTEDNEVVCVVKTTLDSWDRLRDRAEVLHPYEVPCILKVEVEANRAYEDWVRGEVKG